MIGLVDNFDVPLPTLNHRSPTTLSVKISLFHLFYVKIPSKVFSIFRFVNIIWDNYLQTFIHSKYSENNLNLFQLPAAGFYTQLVQWVFVRFPFYFTSLHFSNGSGLRLRCNVLRVCWEPRSWRRPPIRVKLPHNQSSLGGQTFVDFASGAGFFLNFIHHQYFIQSITLLHVRSHFVNNNVSSP